MRTTIFYLKTYWGDSIFRFRLFCLIITYASCKIVYFLNNNTLFLFNKERRLSPDWFFFLPHSSAVGVLLIHFQLTKNKENVLYRKSPLYVMHWRWHCSNNFTLWMIRYACVCYWDIVIFFIYLAQLTWSQRSLQCSTTQHCYCN